MNVIVFCGNMVIGALHWYTLRVNKLNDTLVSRRFKRLEKKRQLEINARIWAYKRTRGSCREGPTRGCVKQDDNERKRLLQRIHDVR